MFTFRALYKSIAMVSLGVGITTITSADVFDPAVDGLLRNQQRQDERTKIIQPEREAKLDTSISSMNIQFKDIQESTCFEIQNVNLVGQHSENFAKYLNKALSQLGFDAERCLGENRINVLMTKTQNLLIDAGFTTSRILASPQNLSSGNLELTIIPGLIKEIKFDLTDINQTHANRIQHANNIFPIQAGDILNLRALEQGLENLKRVPTADADLQIVPADSPNESIVLVKWKQRKIPVRLTMSLDDAGSSQTGKYQGNVTLSVDNPLFKSDLLYFTVGSDLANSKKITDENGREVKSGTNNYALHYSIPYKNWLLSLNASHYNYDQAVSGLNNVYNYNGESYTQEVGLTRLLYRDAKRKTTATLKGWHRTSKSFIDDAELTVQRRNVSGWQANLDHREYFGSTVLDLSLGYKRGTGAFGALRAPEEVFNEGTSRMEIWTFDAGLNAPFKLADQNFSYSSSFHGQYNQTPLSPQDRLAIGGRYSVRGFDGDMTLSADRGFYWRNDLAWAYTPSHQIYTALDFGYVDGQSAQWLLGKHLIGAAVGLRGQFKPFGSIYYDVFAGVPIKKPDYFPTDKLTFGFSLNYSF